MSMGHEFASKGSTSSAEVHAGLGGTDAHEAVGCSSPGAYRQSELSLLLGGPARLWNAAQARGARPQGWTSPDCTATRGRAERCTFLHRRAASG